MTEPTTTDYPVTTTKWSCRDRDERLYPKGEWAEHSLFGAYISNEHPFLQALVNMKAQVTILQREITVFAVTSMAMIHVYPDFINLECIATPVDYRREGSGTKMMWALIEASNISGIPIRLRACNVTGGNWLGLPDHVVVGNGKQKKGKLPTVKLQKWYQKFGFEVMGIAMHHGKKAGINMQYTPKPSA